MTGIYLIQNNITFDFYIGASKNVKIRIASHKSLLRHNKHKNTYLQHSWNKYGEAAFSFAFIQVVETSMLISVEQEWLNRFAKQRNCFNVSINAERVREGSKLSDQTKEKIRLGNQGKLVSDETKARLSRSLKGNKNRLGKLHSKETKDKLSLIHVSAARQYALRQNIKMYIPERPCKFGHMLRYVSSSDCVKCAKLRHKRSKSDE